MHQYDTYFKARAKDHLAYQQILLFQTNNIINHKGERETIDSLIIGPLKNVWSGALSNKIGNLAQCNDHGVHSNDTIDFIFISKVLKN